MVDGEIVIAPRGRLVYGGLTLADVSQAIEQAVRYWPSVVLDLEKVEAIDAAGLGRIAGSYRLATEKGISFRLRNPTRRIQEVLRITRLAEVIPVSCGADEECLVACEAGAG
jgi:anti-anti-sigma factor